MPTLPSGRFRPAAALTRSLIGRATDLAAACELLARSDLRLLTFIGPGGAGKTRLSAAVAQALVGTVADGIWWVALDAIRDPALLVPAVAHALGVEEMAGPPLAERLLAYLGPRRTLLVLDNFEQVAAAAPLLEDWLEAAPGLQILVSSRSPLYLSGEHVFVVPPLRRPALRQLPPLDQLAAYPAVQLFVERAREAQPAFTLTPENAPAVAAICARLDGLPLALELAAAQVRLLDPATLLARLDRPLDVLTSSDPDVPPRQQSLRGAIGWSYDLLDPAHQVVFRRLGVFTGDWTLDAAQAVVGGPGDLAPALRSLVAASLLQWLPGDPVARYALPVTIRAYAQEQLAAHDDPVALGRAHAAYYTMLAEDAEAELRGPQQEAWLLMLEREHDNLRAALGWALAQGAPAARELGLRLAGALWRFWQIRGHLSEGRGWLASLLTAPLDDPAGVAPAVRAKAENGAGNLAWRVGDHAAAHTHFAAGLALRQALDDRRGVASSLNNLGLVARDRGDYAAARDYFTHSLARARESGDQWGTGNVLNNLGFVALNQDELPTARMLLRESLALLEALGDRQNVANVLNNLGSVACAMGDLTAARTFHQESLDLARQVGDKLGIGYSLTLLGVVALRAGDLAAARRCYHEGLALRQELGDSWGVAESLEELAGLAVATDQPGQAATLLGAAQALRDALAARRHPLWQQRVDRYSALAQARLDPAAWAAAWTAGLALPPEAAVALVLDNGGKGL